MENKKTDLTEFWEANPETNVLYVSNDGQVFLRKDMAESHGRPYQPVSRNKKNAKKEEGEDGAES